MADPSSGVVILWGSMIYYKERKASHMDHKDTTEFDTITVFSKCFPTI